jgi:hypothetical protein
VNAKSAEAERMLKMLLECIMIDKTIVKGTVRDCIYDKLTLGDKEIERYEIRKIIKGTVVLDCCCWLWCR